MCSRWAYFDRKFEICQSSSCVVTEVHRLPAYFQQITVHIVSKYVLYTMYWEYHNLLLCWYQCYRQQQISDVSQYMVNNVFILWSLWPWKPSEDVLGRPQLASLAIADLSNGINTATHHRQASTSHSGVELKWEEVKYQNQYTGTGTAGYSTSLWCLAGPPRTVCSSGAGNGQWCPGHQVSTGIVCHLLSTLHMTTSTLYGLYVKWMLW